MSDPTNVADAMMPPRSVAEILAQERAHAGPPPPPARQPRMVALPRRRSGGDSDLPTQLIAPDEPLWVQGGDEARVKQVLDAAARGWGAPTQTWGGLEVHLSPNVQGDSEHSGRTIVRKTNGQVAGGRMDVQYDGKGDVAATSLAHEVGHLVLGGDYEHKDPRWRDPKFWASMSKALTADPSRPGPDMSSYVVDWQGYAGGGEVGGPAPFAAHAPNIPLMAAASGPITLVDPETRRLVGLDDPSQLPDLMDLGYRPAAPDEVALARLKAHYENFGQTAAAFGEGAADTLLPVIAPALEQALGVSAQDQQYRAMFHPLARGAGALTGAIGGAALGVGAPGLIGKAGTVVSRALGTGVLGAAASGALEGGLYSASDVANRAVLGDPGLTAEVAMRQVGLGTLIGGGLGALGGYARKFAADHAEQWSGDLRDFAADRTMKSLGGIQSDRADLVKRYGEAGYLQMMREIGESSYKPVGPFTTPQVSHGIGGTMMDDAWTAMKSEMAKAGQAGTTVSGDELLGRLRGIVGELDGNPWAASAVSKMEAVVDRYSRGLAGKALSVEDVHALRKEVSDAIGFSRGAVDFDSNLTKGAMHDFRNAMSDSIEDALQRSSVGSEAWKAANRQYQLGAIVQKLAQRGINRAEGNNIVSPTELLTGLASGVLGGGAEAAQGEGGGLLGRALGQGLIGTAATALVRRQGSHVLAWLGVRGASALEKLATGVESEVGDAVERAFAGAGGFAAAKTADLFTPENFSERSAEINQFAADPQKALAALSDPTLDRFIAPVMDQVRGRVAGAVATLSGRIPRYDVTGPLDPVYQPSRSELSALNRTAEIARDPMAVLAHLGEGSLTPDHVQALDAIWPAYGQLIRMKALERVGHALSKHETVSPRLRAGLGVLLGWDLTRSTTGQAIAAAQASYSRQQSAPTQGNPSPQQGPRTRDVQTRIARRFATSTQAARENLEGGRGG
ncbi:MAG TPA: hypothetical protein VF841_16780 [Anaeromyxobacter sp.]